MELRRLIVTNKGQELMAKVLSGETTIEFSKIVVSSKSYADDQILSLTALEGIRQETNNLSVAWKGNAAIQVQTALENSSLLLGYNIYTFGLYAKDDDGAEILFAVASANVPSYMPAYNGITVSGIHVKLTFAMSNAESVNITVDPAAVATVGDIQILQEEIKKIQSKWSNENIILINPADGLKYEIGMDENGVYITESEVNPDAVVLNTKTLEESDTVAVTVNETTYGVENATATEADRVVVTVE